MAKLWRLAERLEGTIGNCGTHAAGVVICDHDLTDHVALYKASNSDTVATQVEMKCVEEVGLLKMDFLGLRTLTVVHEAVRLIREGRGVHIDIDNISCDDDKTYALLRSQPDHGRFPVGKLRHARSGQAYWASESGRDERPGGALSSGPHAVYRHLHPGQVQHGFHRV